MLSVIGSLLIGLVVGFIARALKPGDDKLGWIMTALLGVAGSFVASYAGQALGWYGPGEAAGFIASVVGAIVLLVVYGLVKGKEMALNIDFLFGLTGPFEFDGPTLLTLLETAEAHHQRHFPPRLQVQTVIRPRTDALQQLV